MKKSQVSPRSWNAAIRAVQQNMLELAASVPLTDEQDQILTAAFVRCENLTARRVFRSGRTNAQLAEKYAISPRTVTNWRREGCPFASGQTPVVRWLARRRYAPAGAREKFGEQLRKWRSSLSESLRDVRAKVLQERARCESLGFPVPDWLRRMPFRAR